MKRCVFPVTPDPTKVRSYLAGERAGGVKADVAEGRRWRDRSGDEPQPWAERRCS